MSYIIKFDTKSQRVKGLCFHPKRPWILASLHSGVIQLWDYRSSTLIEKFEEHEGPVRGIDFHKEQPLFVSGGDDYKIKVWNYKLRRCLFNLTGHLDYIRTTFFHHESPWILSSSDDQTARIWNWQSRTSVCILTGHTHYVMCARFHPKDDLVVSASLDQTVRVWDISGLRKKNVTPSSHGSGSSIEDHIRFLTSGNQSAHSQVLSSVSNTDLFGSCDVVCKYVMEGHDRGVNCVEFHRSIPIVVSCGDDKSIKLWRMTDSRAWELETLRGHSGNVSSVLFHPRQDLLLSNGEDKCIRIWDLAKRACLATIKRDSDRFWIITAHPHYNLFAAGHDSGLVVFKLERERPAYQTNKDTLYYVKSNQLRILDFKSAKDVPLMQLKDGRGHASFLAYNASEDAVLVMTRSETGTLNNSPTSPLVYDLYCNISKSGASEGPRAGQGLCVAWVGRNKFAVLESIGCIAIKNLSNEVLKKLDCPGVEQIFSAGTGMLLIRDANSISAFDVINKRQLQSIKTPKPVRHVCWSADSSQFAMFSKLALFICRRDGMETVCTVHETMKIKSGIWAENNVFIYTTSNHIKYCLTNGDHGIIRTLDMPVYLTRIQDDRVFCLDRECVPNTMGIDTTEYKFKLALINRRYEQVLHMVKNSALVGQSIIGYLEEKGYPEVALHFVKDPRTRFTLGLECGQLQVALDSAKVIDDAACWEKLAQAAMRQGNVAVAEIAYQRVKDFDRLSFLYLITGQLDKLSKMHRIAEIRGDLSAQFFTGLLLGDLTETVKCLQKAGQHSLAYLAAQTHALDDQLDKITLAGEPPKSFVTQPMLIQPSLPIGSCASDWPMQSIIKEFFESDLATGSKIANDDEQFFSTSPTPEPVGHTSKSFEDDDNEQGVDIQDVGWDVDDDDLQVDELQASSTSKQEICMDEDLSGTFVPPNVGRPIQKIWSEQSRLAGDQCCAGNWTLAMRRLHDEIGVVDFQPYKTLFMQCYAASRSSIHGMPHLPSIWAYPSHGWSMSGASLSTVKLTPARQFSLDDQLALVEEAYNLTTKGKFHDAISKFRQVLLTLPLLVVDTTKQERQAFDLISICKEYIVGLSMELARKALPKDSLEDQIRTTEMACYFTHCKLKNTHLILTLRTALNSLFKLKNYRGAAKMAQRLLDIKPSSDVAAQAKKVLIACENMPDGGQDTHQIKYEPMNHLDVCAASFEPIHRGQDHVKDHYSGACYQVSYARQVCHVTQCTEIGLASIQGLHIKSVESAS